MNLALVVGLGWLLGSVALTALWVMYREFVGVYAIEDLDHRTCDQN